MAEEHEFAQTWTFRDPMTTVEYPRGWRGVLPADRLKAAREAGVLVTENPIPMSDTRPFEHQLERKKATTRTRKKPE